MNLPPLFLRERLTFWAINAALLAVLWATIAYVPRRPMPDAPSTPRSYRVDRP